MSGRGRDSPDAHFLFADAGILSKQCKEGKWGQVAYRSKTIQDAKFNYDIHDKELLAIIQALKNGNDTLEEVQH